MSRNTILSILLLIFSSQILSSQNIAGNNLVCQYDCEVYTIENASGGLFIWNIEGGKLDVNTGTTVKVCWKEEGLQEIRVLDLSDNAPSPILTYTVDVNAFRYPEIYFPEIPSCETLDSIIDINQEFPPLECRQACENSTATYTAIGQENSSYTWTQEGALSSNVNGQSIDINWGEAGYGVIILTENSEAGCDNIAEYCIQILESPSATIIDETNIVTPCIGQAIYLTADSPEAVEFSWEVNETIFSNEQSIEFIVESEDIINVSLVTTSECMCKDTTTYIVTPKQNAGPKINCVGTTCLGSEETYFAENICGTYTWNVSQEGTIAEGGGSNDNFVSVIWNSGPVGEITLAAANCQDIVCSSVTSVKVPILGPTVDIEGPDVTCKKGVSVFTAPKFAGTTYSWSITGNGLIIDNSNSNQISVLWSDTPWSDNTATISLNYENCLLECSGTAQKTITLKPEFNISSWEPEVCFGEEINIDGISSYSSVNGDWEVFDNQGTLIASATNEFNIQFNAPDIAGLVEIILTNTSGEYCNETSTGFITVVPPPSSPIDFEGPLVICQNESYTYEGSIDLQNDIQLIWTFNDGANSSTVEGNLVNYTWLSSGPYSIELIAKSIVSNCESPALFAEVKESNETSITGQTDVCIDELSKFSLSGVESQNITWEISPATAGNFKIGEGIDTEIIFYEVGSHQLTANYCGTNISVNVNVFGKPTFTHNAPIGICEDDEFTIAINTDATNTIEVSDENFNIVSTTSNFNIGPGIYTFKIISPFGCEEIEVVNIKSYDLPDIRISSPDTKGKCTFPLDVRLFANDAIDGYTYKWFQDGIELTETTDILTANEFADYYLEVTNSNGCTNISNTIKVYQECRFSDEYCDARCENLVVCESSDSTNFNATTLGFCNTYSFMNSSTANVDPANIKYDFDDPQSGINNIVFQANAEHTFSHAGFYTVMIIGKVPSLADPSILCDDYEVQLIEVPVAANFESQRSCPNTEYEFLDKSTFVDNNTIVNYEWNFGDPSSGVNNTSTDRNPKHIYTTTGTFLVTLTITSGTGCQSRIIKEVQTLPEPIFDLNLPFEQCISEAIKFEALDTGNLIKFKWEFDNPTGGNSNLVESVSTLHQFQTPGIYSVSLTCQNNVGCESTVVKSFEVGTNNLIGDITLDQSLPICEGDSITLTAPNGGVGYIWSNGEVQQTIKVSDPEEYSVTVINASACDYIPEPVIITVKPKPNIQIYAITYEENQFQGTQHFERLEICEGTAVGIRTQFIPSASYSWSSGGTTWFNSELDSRLLSPGEHEITLDVTTNGCTFTSDPFKIVVNPLPTPFTISSNVSNMCEGEEFNLMVDNPDPELTYYWSTGQTEVNITAQIADSYYVTAINKFGCTQTSNTLTIYEKPNMTFFQTGCFETCFPDEICFPQSGSVSLISWLKDGQIINSANSNTLTVTEAGEYQVVVESSAGCTETSDILTLEAMPSDQSVGGIVYVDSNENGVFDASEELLENIDIHLMTGTTILETSTTNALGEYLIDPVTSTNTYLLLDTIGTGLILTNLELQYDLTFDLCVEDKIQDFPVTKTCPPIIENLNLIVCQGETVTFNNTTYSAGDSDNVLVTSGSGCDTTFNIMVSEAQVPLINSTTTPSCKNTDNGELNIQSTELGLTYSIDGINFSNNVNFPNLPAGNYTLEVMNENNCIYSFPYTIQEVLDPVAIMDANNSCPQLSTGTIEITTSEIGLNYSIDGVNFTNSNSFTNLPAANYDVTIMNSNGCTYIYNIDVTESQEPSISFDTSPACSNENNGMLEITSAESGTTFSMDGTSFSTSLIFDNLPSGNQTLYVNNQEQCTFEYNVDINENASPVYTIASQNTCLNENNGSIEVQTTEVGLTYSLDGVNYTTQNNYTNLAEGDQNLFIQNDLGCIYQEVISIESNSLPDVSLNTKLACNNDGELDIIVNDGNSYSYSLTNSGFNNNTQITNLAAGNHSVFILDNNNCVTEQSFTIQESIEPLLQFDIVPTCASESNGTIEAISNNTLVKYSLNGGSFSNNNLFENIDKGDYTLTVMDEFGCTFENQISVDEIESLSVSFEDPIMDCSIKSVNLTPEILSGQYLDFEWSNGSVSNSLTATQSGLFSVKISNGCETESYEWDLQFDNIDTKSVFVPNTFSPNNDGDNDNFQAFKAQDLNIVDFDLSVFDKWGNIVYQNSDMSKTWDGRNNSENVQTGVYIWKYKITANFCDEEISLNKMGSVTLLR